MWHTIWSYRQPWQVYIMCSTSLNWRSVWSHQWMSLLMTSHPLMPTYHIRSTQWRFWISRTESRDVEWFDSSRFSGAAIPSKRVHGRPSSFFVLSIQSFSLRSDVHVTSFVLPHCSKSQGEISLRGEGCNIPASNPCNNLLDNGVILNLSQIQ
jgi:hypothetical protein